MEAYQKARQEQIKFASITWVNKNLGVKGECGPRMQGFRAGAKWYDSIYPNKLTKERLAEAKEKYLADIRPKDKEPKGIGFEAGAEWASTTPPRLKQLELFKQYDD